MGKLHEFVLHPELVRSAASRGQTIKIIYSEDGLTFTAMTTNEVPSNDGGLSG